MTHSLSPVIHNAAFEATGFDGVYVALPVARGRAADAVEAVRTLDLLGLSVTMPHKTDILAACDVVTDRAAALDAGNCVYVDERGLVADNTDGAGFIAGLRSLDVDPADARCLVIGAGGAARAVIRSLASAGAGRIAVANRTPERAQAAIRLAGDAGVTAGDDDLTYADLVVNATPAGMADTDCADEIPVDLDRLSSDVVVCDLVYHPAESPLLAAARDRGLRRQNGIPMLVHQAAAQFQRWTGLAAPIDAMSAAASQALAAREAESSS